MSDRFYIPDLLGAGEFVLTGPEAHHLVAVRRFGDGDEVVVFNGDGNDYPAQILSAGKKSVVLLVREPVFVNRELPFPVVVASALPKGDRADFLVEKLTELGVNRFIPLITTRAVVLPKVSVVEKFGRAVIEASKQCGRNCLMQVDAPQKWDSFVARADLPQPLTILHTGPGLVGASGAGGTLAVGPEGGFTTEEVERALTHGFVARSLGSRVLRTETAAIAAAARLGEGTKINATNG
ncbi:Ribosomal RNA small subunit methyltransferase E [Gemmata obscuriglobus]|uniref:Ribosomal RNA small subunit methyltransferase E n=1 Tax=Gemmata obscuriglobus TaxID=114 RepID=A0A2Z3GWQ6_9BACT|nr:RsmE family RNA methyltransferase [Gemmata obscuriglobus]AWM37768.1 RNA methyltransferase RsmE [Gemmata obscuriglobus]QEG29419.1 Ribosomal RNA small subunit methyltransferase E [Gemmata obscuriglobus]VTS08512.1 16s rrna methyltransferase : Ribosomal RNA small subunit methyltransferase E OS=Singulisphaera acidiphila (strain ATCC BAA-1392 / DSM 18658 / VKM B-2454 / MOB10) GN=Sinac_1541 PE=3 SV=1: Methyltrans_RNA [Gemmata obscuriglobus UQM 2246]